MNCYDHAMFCYDFAMFMLCSAMFCYESAMPCYGMLRLIRHTLLPLLSFPTFLIGNPASLLFSSFVKTRDGTQAVPYKILRE